jgi:putative membrane protein
VLHVLRINRKELKWFIILIGFTYYIFYLISTKKLYLFIHPRMTIYMDLSLFIFIILSLLQVKKIFKAQDSNVKGASTIFLVPLVLVYIVNPQGLNGTIVSQKGYSTDSIAVTTTASNHNARGSQGNLIKPNEKNYYDVINDIKYNANKYKGKKITIGGFVYKDETFPKDTFVVGRLIIICCAADAELTGLVVKMNNSTLQNDQWVEATGSIDVIPNFDKDDPINKTIPVINVTNVKTIAKPSNPYIYMKGSGGTLSPSV